ncbi:MAG TPA: flavin reductase family protein [Baekduia sp.]|nr:flavin reductase family protein [Baekduia sp.]
MDVGDDALAEARRPGITAEVFKEAMGRFVSGVTVVTAVDGGRPVGTTANAVSSLSAEPPMLIICMNRTSTTGAAIRASGCFAVNVLAEDQADLAQRFATKDPDKFQGVDARPGLDGVPLLSGSLATLECRVVEEAVGGTHSVFLAEVATASAREGAPLTYYRSQFGRLGLMPIDHRPR